jgi:hypothetical protein
MVYRSQSKEEFLALDLFLSWFFLLLIFQGKLEMLHIIRYYGCPSVELFLSCFLVD